MITVLGRLHFDHVSPDEQRVWQRDCLKTFSLQTDTISGDIESRRNLPPIKNEVFWKKLNVKVQYVLFGPLKNSLEKKKKNSSILVSRVSLLSANRPRYPSLCSTCFPPPVSSSWKELVQQKAVTFEVYNTFATIQITTNILLASLDFVSTFIESVNFYCLQMALAIRKRVVIVRAYSCTFQPEKKIEKSQTLKHLI